MPDEAPESVADGFRAAWNAHDAAALAALFEAEADFVNVTGLHWTRRAEIEAAHAYGFARIFAGSRLEMTARRVRRLGPDLALLVVHWSLTGQTAPDGTPAGPRRTVMSFLVRRAADGWRALAAHNTDRIPGAETFVRRDGRLAPASYRAGPDDGAAG